MLKFVGFLIIYAEIVRQGLAEISEAVYTARAACFALGSAPMTHVRLMQGTRNGLAVWQKLKYNYRPVCVGNAEVDQGKLRIGAWVPAARLLDAMAGVPDGQRGAQFHCVLVYLRHAEDPTPIICHGRWPGSILRSPQGDGGFGYDPVFLAPEHGCSAAELSRAEKGSISHRGRALKILLDQLKAEA